MEEIKAFAVDNKLTNEAAQAMLGREEAAVANLKTLKGHRSVGGMRASIYNAMPVEGVEALVRFMSDFEKTNA